MKKIIIFSFVSIILLSSCHNRIWDAIDNLDSRVTKLEELCKEMNTNITALQTLVATLDSHDYIDDITPVTKDGKQIGYVITFGQHDPITIYNGTEEVAPVVGVAKDTDSIYYWTLNGTWLLGTDGEKLPVSGTKGDNGITPQLKVDGDYWYVSYDNGTTWAQLGKATGEKGDAGDSMFSDVTYDNNYVYFTLTNGTTIAISRSTSVNGVLPETFSVSATKQVHFSQGNLQYQASTGTWRFAEHQYDVRGTDNDNISATYTGWIDLFGWGTSGYHDTSDTYNTNYYPYSTSASIVNTTYNYYGYGPSSNMTDQNLTGTSAYYDWGMYNAISNGGNTAGKWRTLTGTEWEYLFSSRANAASLRFIAMVGGHNGIVVLPDNWTSTADVPSGYILSATDYNSNIIDSYQWKDYESYGAVFLPCAGYRQAATTTYSGSDGYYWSSSSHNSSGASEVFFSGGTLYPNYSSVRYYGYSVRLVQDK